ncbi:MAG: nucleotidyltransferase family protein [Alphaproteobacteria bacterium]
MDEDVLDRLKRLKPHLLKSTKIERLRLFGSYATGQATKQSDVDILLTFKETPDLFELGGIHTVLSEGLGKKVDIAVEDYLLPEFRDRILNEARDV